jgi:uncharacterized protein (TIGR03437 family)
MRISRSLSVLALSLVWLAGTLAAQTLSVSATSLSFSSALGGASQQQTLNLTSTGASLTFAIFPSVSWLTTAPTSGTTPSAVTVTVNPSSLAAGSNTGNLEIINVNNPSNTVNVPVTVLVSAVGASPSALSFSYQLGGTLPATQAIDLTGSLTTFTASSSATWLTVTSSGNVPGAVAVSVNSAASALAAGTDNATITITPATGTPISVAVTLTVAAEATVTASSSSLSFDYQIGGANNSVSQTITLSATGTATQSYSISSLVNPNPSGQDWILVNPSSGTIPGGGSVQVTISYNTLDSITAPGTYTGTLTISTPTAIAATPTVPVSLLVSNSPLLSVPSNTLSFLYEVSGPTPAAQSVTAVSTNVAASSTTGQLPITVSATSTGNWLAVTQPSPAQTGTPFSVSVNPAGLSVGTYNGTVTITATGAGNGPQTIPVVLTVANDPVPLVTPAALSFAYEIGKSQPAAQNISIVSSTGAGLNYSATAASTQCGGAWLTLSGNASGSVSGTTAGSFTANIGTTGLTASVTCAGTIKVTATNAATGAAAPGSPVTIPVTLYVSTNPLLVTSTPSLSFTAQVSGSSPAAQTITIASTDPTVVLNYTTTFTTTSGGSSWLFVAPVTGSTASGSNMLTVSVLPGLLSAGTYSGTITLTATGATVANSPVIIPVTFQVTSATLSASPTSLAFTATAGGSAPASQSLQISANGGAVNFTAVASITQSAALIPSWLSVTPGTGTTPATLTVSASGVNLPAGTYSGQVTVSAPNTVAVNVPVTFTVNAGSISASPTSLSFTEAAGTPTAATQTVTVTATPSSLTYTVSVSMANGASANWLSASASGGTVTVSASSAALAAGGYTGSVTITASGATGSPITIPVMLTVMPAQSLAVSPSSLTFNYVLNASAPAAQTVTLTTSGGAAPFTVTTSGGTWLQVTPTSGTTPATLSISIATTGLAAGTYSGTVTVSSTSATQTATVTVSMTVAAVPTPTVGGVANAGSYVTGSVAPGENIYISGTGIGPATSAGLQLTPAGSVATTVSNTQVTFDGTPAPIIYVSANQTSVMVPFEVGGRPTTVLQVSYMGVKSAPLTYNVSSAVPGIYTQNSQGFGPGAILNQNNTVNGPSQPAAAGSYVAVYLTGTGNTSPAGSTGAVIPSNGTGLKTIALPVTAAIGGLPANVAYKGSAPGDVEGVMQVNLQIPSGLATGAQPIVITLGSGNTTYTTQTGVTVQVQ